MYSHTNVFKFIVNIYNFLIYIYMSDSSLIKSVLTETALIQLHCVGFKSNNEYVYQVVTYFRFTHRVHRSKRLDGKKAIQMFHEMSLVSV